MTDEEMADCGLLSEIGRPRKGPAPGYKAPIKYRGPNGETWTGRGLLPRWIKDSGKDKKEFAITWFFRTKKMTLEEAREEFRV